MGTDTNGVSTLNTKTSSSRPNPPSTIPQVYCISLHREKRNYFRTSFHSCRLLAQSFFPNLAADRPPHTRDAALVLVTISEHANGDLHLAKLTGPPPRFTNAINVNALHCGREGRERKKRGQRHRGERTVSVLSSFIFSVFYIFFSFYFYILLDIFQRPSN